ncbi:MAG: restriction alleviation protein, Lar family [Rhodocyclaceae bacterium]|nr:MAG: restriction alleviation protein, Lar family [Rhodocyclaceae bacterium]
MMHTLPCPFCGSTISQSIEIDAEQWAIYCVQCNCIGPARTSAASAIDIWNERHQAEQQRGSDCLP